MKQGALFPIQLVDEIESPYLHAKDSRALGVDHAENEYLLKRLEDGPLLPITEWLGHHLCRLCGVPTPEFAVVLRPNGEPCFGSRIEAGVVDFNRAPLSQAQMIAIVRDAAASESAALMLDAFLPNPDRHFGNWLYAARRGQFVALSIDWSRVSALHAPAFDTWPWQAGCNSDDTHKTLDGIGALQANEVRRVARALTGIGDDDVHAIVQSAPELWRKGLDEDAILNWWRVNRVQRIDDSLSLLLP